MHSKDGAGNKIIAMIDAGTWPKTIPDTATTLSGCFFTIPFQTACITVANRIIKNFDKLEKNLPTIPSTLREELTYNIFLRAKNLKDFSKLRDLKDNF